MSENISEKAPESEEPQGGVPQGVADGIAVLAGEVRAAERKATAGWKISAIVWCIILAVIFSYLYFWLYKSVLKPAAEPQRLVALGKYGIDIMLEGQGLPTLDSAQLPGQLAEKLRAQAPGLIQDQLKPRLRELEADLPKHRRELAQWVRENASDLADQGVERLQNDLLPAASEQAVQLVDQKVDEVLTQVDEDINQVMGDVISTTLANIDDVRDAETVRMAMELAFEDAMGEVLDELFEGLDEKVGQVREKMQALVQKQRTGNLTHKDRLELRMIQLVRELFKEAALEEAVEGEGIAEQLRRIWGELGGLELPEATEVEARRAIEAGVRRPGRRAQPADIDLSTVPEAERARIRAAIERGMAGARRPLEAAPTPTDIPEEAREAVEEARRAAEEAAEEGRKRAEEGRKDAEEARKKALEDAGVEPAPGAPAAAGPPADLEKIIEEAKKRAEEARKKGEAAAAARGGAATEAAE